MGRQRAQDGCLHPWLWRSLARRVPERLDQEPAGVGDFLELQNVSASAVTLATADGWTLALRANDGSPLCDAVQYTRQFEVACREAWREWCAQPMNSSAQ